MSDSGGNPNIIENEILSNLKILDSANTLSISIAATQCAQMYFLGHFMSSCGNAM